jgi:exosortase/archaeosortase family protein
MQAEPQPSAYSQRWASSSLLGYVLVTMTLMVGLYALLYHPYAPGSLPARALDGYLRAIAASSSVCLDLLGEQTRVEGATVFGRFSFLVVIDCAALDAQALFAAAVTAFPAAPWKRLLGLLLGLPAILALNVARLVALYFAGASSLELFHLLHEEVFVGVIIVLVCLMFAGWAAWARRSHPWLVPRRQGPVHAH